MFNSKAPAPAAAALCALKGYYCANAARARRLTEAVRKVHTASTVEAGAVSVARTALAGTPVGLTAVTEAIVVARANFTELTIEVRGCC